MTANIQDVANKAFDYVIVGKSLFRSFSAHECSPFRFISQVAEYTAGLTLAARLSADPSKTVLVLEAGEAHLNNRDILAVQMYGSHFANELYSYRHKWVTQKHAADREGVWERGKGLGGSSAINFMGWFRPPSRDIDDWEKLGNPGWTFSNFLTAVNRTEGLIDPPEDIAQRNYLDTKEWKVGRDGPVKLSFPAVVDEGETRIMETFHKDGFKKNPTPYNGDPSGYWLLPSTRDPKTNTRSYATTAFYQPNAHRTNLTVLVTALARRVLLSDADPNGEVTATGVEFEHGGKVYEVKANNEVVLSAGTLTSPHLLELSGIGRRDVLAKIDVPLKVELPGVGENLQEHIYGGVSFELTNDAPLDTLDILADPAVLAKHIELAQQGKGLFHAGCVGIGQLALSQLTPRAPELHAKIVKIVQDLEEEVAELQKGRRAGNDSKEETDDEGLLFAKQGLLDQYRLLEERYSDKEGEGSPGFEWISFPACYSFPNLPTPGKRYVTMMLVLNHGFSRGTVHSASKDPSEAPEIDPRYLSKDIDLELMYEHFVRMRHIASLSPFKDMIARELNPGPEVSTEEDIKKWIRNSFATIYHTIGTCSMLPKEKGGVVSPELKVYGTKNLRVVDISVVPLHVGANTQSTAYGLGEIAADIIEGKWPPA
ncbi:alcohol oxidase [Cytidiella melzeri]|nr:alcohol oxidase [Cytidiella melzeri]